MCTRANCVAVAASGVTNVAPARSPMARTIPDPTEYIPGSSKRPARSRSSRISRQSDRMGHALLEKPRHVEPERLRGLEVDDQIEFSRLLDGQVSRLRTLENLVYKIRRPIPEVGKLHSVSNQAANL